MSRVTHAFNTLTTRDACMSNWTYFQIFYSLENYIGKEETLICRSSNITFGYLINLSTFDSMCNFIILS